MVKNRKHGLLALSPLVVFLAIYFISSIIVGDFYRIPIASAFLLASVYALAITPDASIEEKIGIFSRGAGHPNVLLMIWIFILAGTFAVTAKKMGAIDATVNLTLMILPGKMLFAGLFLASCFVSMAVGTSVGTIVALMPIASGLAAETAVDPAYMAAIIVGGAFFGDNLSFISDTTIAASRSLGCSMSDKFKANIKIVFPAALIACAIYFFQGLSVEFTAQTEPVQWLKLLPYLMVIVLAVSGVNVLNVLVIGLALNAVIGFCSGDFVWDSFLSAMGDGIGGMGELIIVTMLAGGMLELIKHNGGIDYIVQGLTRRISGRRGAEFSIAGLVSLANFCTANNTIAIITVGQISKDIAERYGLEPRRVASILDTFSCLVQGILPYGAQLLMASALVSVSPVDIIAHLTYPLILGICAVVAIVLGFRK